MHKKKNENYITFERKTGFFRHEFVKVTKPYNGNVRQGRKSNVCLIDVGQNFLSDGAFFPNEELIKVPLSMSQIFYAFGVAMKNGKPLDVTREGVAAIRKKYPDIEKRRLHVEDIKRFYGGKNAKKI